MDAVSGVVLAYRAKQLLVARRMGAVIAAQWAHVDPANPLASWARQIPLTVSLMRQGMRASAAGSTQYVSMLVKAQGVTPAPQGTVSADAFAETAVDGRPLGSLLYLPAVTARDAADNGLSLDEALSRGGSQLAMLVATELADVGRSGVSAAQLSDRAVTGYFRQPGPGACARCAILAGQRSAAIAFERHPRCQCTAVSATEHYKRNTTAPSSSSYFDSLSRQRQAEVFGKANAQAIRDGADPAAVINARRGMSHPGFNWTTTEGTTRRSVYGGYHINADGRSLTKRAKGDKAPPRLTPSAIYRVAATREEAVSLLSKYGYLR